MKFQMTNSIELIEAVENGTYFVDHYYTLDRTKGYEILIQHQVNYYNVTWEDWADSISKLAGEGESFYKTVEVLYETVDGVYVRMIAYPYEVVNMSDTPICNPVLSAIATTVVTAAIGLNPVGMTAAAIGAMFTMMNTFAPDNNDIKTIEAFKN